MPGDDWADQWAADAARFMEAETTRLTAEVEAAVQAAQETPELFQADDAKREGAPSSAHLGIVSRREYVPKAEEGRYLARDSAGAPNLRLVDTGDRLTIWSPAYGGGLINPKGPGLRALGLATTYARGSQHHASAFRAADLRKGQQVELRRDPSNPYDSNAVALHGPNARSPFGYVQRGRAAAIARRMDNGEHLGGVSLRGPGKGRDDETAFLLLGSRADLQQMLTTVRGAVDDGL